MYGVSFSRSFRLTITYSITADFFKEILISVSYFVYPNLYKQLVNGHATYELAFGIEGYETAPQAPRYLSPSF